LEGMGIPEEQERLIKDPEGFRRIEIMTSNGEQTLLLRGQNYMSWRCEDQIAPRVAMVQLFKSGLAGQEELAKLFGVHERSVRNYISCFRMEGISGLMSQPRGPKEPWKITPDIRFKILEVAYRRRDLKYEEIIKMLRNRWNVDASINSIRQVLMENGFIEERLRSESFEPTDLFAHTNESMELPLGENGRATTSQTTLVVEPGQDGGGSLNQKTRDRSFYSQGERIHFDQLERGLWSAYAGGLLFAPLIKQYRFLEIIKKVINVPTHEGYSLEQLSLALFYFDVFEFRSIEDFKTVYPEEYGPLIGRSLSPSIWTLRRFLHEVRMLKKGEDLKGENLKGEDLMEEFAKEYLRSGLCQWGVLYIDSHFLPYYGMRVITMGWCGVRDKPIKGSYQFLAVDEKFNPFLFLIRPSSEDLLEKIPELIGKARKIGQDLDLNTEDLTVVFDREGYSAELFRNLDQKMQPKVKFITWAKYMDRWLEDYKERPFDKTATVRYALQEEEEIRYFEIERTMNKYGPIRTLIIESARKNQRSAIFTNSEDDGGKIIELICRRWGQETLNKTHKWDHKMDYHPGYVEEELDEQPLVENPKLKELKREKANLTAKLNGFRIKLAQKAFTEAQDQTSWKEMKEKNQDIYTEMVSLQAQITLTEIEIDKFPKEIPFDQAHNGKQLVELGYEKKRFLDSIKVFAYMMEKKMCSILSKYYDDPNDIYVILSMIVRRGGEIRLEGGRLGVRLRGFKNPEVDFAAKRLCEELNQMQPRTLDKLNLPIRYEVA